jgi:hypothetical protein
LANHLAWDSVGFTPSFPEGDRPLGHHALVEKVRVLGGLSLEKRDSTSVRGDFPAAGVIMPVMRVDKEEPLGLDLRGVESGTQEPYYQGYMGVYGHVLSSWTPNDAPPRNLTVAVNARH